ncbi:MAG: hypothetical protein M3O26_16375, partial [Pseudomonadota bacterium]|nr:hypothetical protein [Pseudomonadota bacterium]
MNDRMYETAAVIIEAECREELKGKTDAAEMMRIAFKTAHNHWMFTNEQDQFKGAIGAVLITLKEGPEFERLKQSVTQLGKLSAMLNALQQGIPVDMERMLEQQQESG